MDWKAIVSTVAPWIASAATGPLGGLAVNAICEALGLDDKSETAIKQAISGATPEQMLALKNADQSFALQMQELGYKNIESLAALAVENTKDARDMQKVTRSKVPALLAGLITLGFFGILTGMMTGELKTQDNQALLILLGALSTSFGGVINFYFGSSQGSQQKSELLAKAQAVK